MSLGVQDISLGLENITQNLWETCTPLDQQLGTNKDVPEPLMVPDTSFMQNNFSPDQYYMEPREMDFYRLLALTRSSLAIQDIRQLDHNTPKFKSQYNSWSHK